MKTATKAIRTKGQYKLYKLENGLFELYYGSKRENLLLGYMADINYFDAAIYECEQELKELKEEIY